MNSCSCKPNDYDSPELYTWCTNCGNYGIHAAVKRALSEECIPPQNTLLCFDIGCHGNGADKINAYTAHGLHGRILPFAAGASFTNTKVIAFAGDGGTFNEGISHLIHTIRSNYNFTFILHNNENFALTTGQASNTTVKDSKNNFLSQFASPIEPINPVEFVLNFNPGFVARGFSDNVTHLTAVLREAFKYKGFSFVEVFQSCPTYNKANTHEEFLRRARDVSEIQGYNSANIDDAKKILSSEFIPTGIIYKQDKKDFLQNISYRNGVPTLLSEEVKEFDVSAIISEFI